MPAPTGVLLLPLHPAAALGPQSCAWCRRGSAPK